MRSRRKTPWINGPAPETQETLNRAMEHIKSVPYAVSLRWLFYRLYQDGIYKTKKGYNAFEFLCSKARHTYWREWTPDTLADETRETIERVFGYTNMDQAIEGLPYLLAQSVNLELDHFYNQKSYIEIWYEARAMTGQFKHYSEKINLVPMGGMASIPFKWEIAKRLDSIREKYGLPVIVLYFGDEDLAGHNIKSDVEEDVRKWSSIDFEVEWCGLTKEQIEKYEIPHSFEKKGYQWEALDDKAAAEIITQSITKHINIEAVKNAKEETERQEEKWAAIVESIIENEVENS